MSQTKLWNQYESSLLLNMYLKVEGDFIEREKAIRILSADLRKMAQNQNIVIDNKYRNYNGIKLQMLFMERLVKNQKQTESLRNYINTFIIYTTVIMICMS